MKPIAEVYPGYVKDEAERGHFYGPSDYQPMIENIADIAVQVDDNDYQGDSRVVFVDGDRRGVLIFGWGSCSGCDALQACSTMAEVEALRASLAGQTKWFETPHDALRYFEEHDWEGDYCWHQEETQQFIEKAKAYLSGGAA